MRTKPSRHCRSEEGYIVAYFVVLAILVAAIAGLCTAVTQSIGISHRRADIAQARLFAEGGAALAASELERAITNTMASSFLNNLANNPAGSYSLDTTLSTTDVKVYTRNITAPFSNQNVTAQIWLTNVVNPTGAKAVGIASVGNATQTAAVHVEMTFQFGAAIISDNPGTTATGTTKPIGQQGNVVVTGNLGTTVVDGGNGTAILANGRANIGPGAIVNTNSLSVTNYATSNEIPKYTAPGSADQLFDFNRFIAVADVSGTHYPNVAALVTAAQSGTVLEGVIVVDVSSAELSTSLLSPAFLPSGINVRGTLVFNFAPDVGALDKIVNSAAVNINPGNLASMNPTNPATYLSGYPPTYANSSKNPINVDITPLGFDNFAAGDDLPALMYNVGFVDLHGPLNICGVVYSPSFIELDWQPVPVTQYIKGAIISGGGVFLDNKTAGNTIIVSYDSNVLDRLATSHGKGKGARTVFWE